MRGCAAGGQPHHEGVLTSGSVEAGSSGGREGARSLLCLFVCMSTRVVARGRLHLVLTSGSGSSRRRRDGRSPTIRAAPARGYAYLLLTSACFGLPGSRKS